MQYISGIDVGTTGCKVSIYSIDGELVKEGYREYKNTNSCEYSTVDVAYIWEKIKEILLELSGYTKLLKSLSITSFGETFVLVGDDDKPLLESMLYTDKRGELECKQLSEKLGEEEIYRITGLRPHIMYSISKLMWVKNNEAELFSKVKQVNLVSDYIAYLFSGVSQIDYTLASRTMAFDINNESWSREILEVAGIEADILPKPVRTGTIAGKIREELAKELGLAEDMEIVTGCHDQVAAAIGTGVIKSGMAVDGTGTVECITSIFDKLPENSALYDGNYAVLPSVNNSGFITYAVSFTGGALLKWYRDELADFSIIYGDDVYHELNKLVKTEPSDLLVLPYFAGAGTPHMDAGAKGAIIGLTTKTESIEIYKALMEGVTYEMLLNLEKLKEGGISINELRATGGGANSSVWLQIKADILNIPISNLVSSQTGTLGCAILAGTATGVFDSLAQGVEKCIKVKETFYPREEQHKKYIKNYRKYRKLYHSIKEIM